MQVVGIVPARGGSKGLPGKHLLPLAGRPLIAWTLAAAAESRTLTRVVVSTDDDAVAEAARELGATVPFVRPASLAADDTPMLDVLLHAVGEIERAGGVVDVVVLLQPTSPLRTGADIDAAVGALLESNADSIVSVVPVPHQFNPVSVMTLEEGRLRPFTPGPPLTRRQDKPLVYARNGPAVLAVRRAVLMEQRSLYGSDVRGLVMTPEVSIDVDTAWDLAIAELALERRRARTV
jgi:CMP-N,N'-diacetyllegionaminic acid synthase